MINEECILNHAASGVKIDVCGAMMDNVVLVRSGLDKREAHCAFSLEEMDIGPIRFYTDPVIGWLNEGLNNNRPCVIGPNMDIGLSHRGEDIADKISSKSVTMADVGLEQVGDSLPSDSSGSCPFPPGYGPCCNGHIHKELTLAVENPSVRVNGGEMARHLIDEVAVNTLLDYSPPVKEAKTVIRVCEEGGLQFLGSEKKLIERDLAEITGALDEMTNREMMTKKGEGNCRGVGNNSRRKLNLLGAGGKNGSK
ncbi:hypothetical protein PIB30_000175 [Stylosanthes scabra]|uniref:Uncharacterized protein n=1 Tax=Stylosanthes scabra TaxID=79078 RepID=A0ABU6R3M2_9FABA|nr:hypothetical protein [Stylosanthes scabra]